MACMEKIKYWKKHITQLSHEACGVTKDIALMFFDTKSYNDKFLRENGEPTMDEYAEIMRKHDLKEEKAKGYYFGEVNNILTNKNER